MTPFSHSGTRQPTVEILPIPAQPFSAREFLFPVFVLGIVCGMAMLLAAMAVWP